MSKQNPSKRADSSQIVHLIEIVDNDEDNNDQSLTTAMKSLDVTSKSLTKQTSSEWSSSKLNRKR